MGLSNINVELEFLIFEKNNALGDGGVLFLNCLNSNIYLNNILVIDNKAEKGAFIYCYMNNSVEVNNLKLERNIAVLLGGFVFSNMYNTLLIRQTTIKDTNSSIYGAFYAERCNEFVLNKVFFLGRGSILNLWNSFLSKFNSDFDMSEIFRLDGLDGNLNISECIFRNVNLFILNDYSKGAIIFINSSFFDFSINYQNRAIFLLASDASSYYFYGNSFFIQGKKAGDFDFFINLLGNYSNLSMKKNLLNYNIFPVLINCRLLWRNLIVLSDLQLNNFRGVILYVSNSPSYNFSSNMSYITLSRIKIQMLGTASHLFEMKSYVSLEIRNSIFYLGDEQHKSILYNVLPKLVMSSENPVVLTVIFSQFVMLRSNKIPDIDESRVSLFQFEKCLNNIYFQKSFIHIGKKFYSALMIFSGNISLHIDRTYILQNHFNYSFSHLILIKFYYDKPKIFLFKSNIKFNRMVSGGFASLEGILEERKSYSLQLDLQQSVIEGNKAVNKGGFLYVNISGEHDMNVNDFYKVLKNVGNKIKNNRATLGSFIFWEGYSVPSLNALMTILKKEKNNTDFSEQQYLVISSSIDTLQIVSSDFKFNQKEIVITNRTFLIKEKVVKNRVLPEDYYFCIALFDKYKQLQYASSENYLISLYGNGKGSMINYLLFDNTNISFEYFRGMYCANKFDFITNYSDIVGKTHKLKFNPLNYLNLFNQLNNSLAIKYEIIFEVDACKIGELFNGQNCIPCDFNKYYLKRDLVSLIGCIFCTDYDNYFCYGASFRSPKKNFWRLNNESNMFLRCPGVSCLGDLDYIRNSSNRECFACFLPESKHKELIHSFSSNFTAVGFCKYPYKGYLCTQCREGFGSTGTYRCGNCSSFWVFFKQIFIFIVKLMIFYYSNWSAINSKLNQSNLKKNELINDFKNSFLLKILFKHLTVLSVLNSMPFEIDENIDNIFAGLISSSPSESFDVFSFECLLKKLGISLAPIYAKIIMNIPFFLLSLILIMVYFKYRDSKLESVKKSLNGKKISFFKRNGKGIILIFALDNILSILEPFLKILFVANIGDESIIFKRLLNDFSIIPWDNQHKLFLFSLTVPTILVLAGIAPLYLLFQIIKATKENKTKHSLFVRNFGYFIFPYEQESNYFEIFIIYNKIILILFKDYLRLSVISNNEKPCLLLLFIYFLSIYCYQSYKSPYKKENFSILQKTEILSILISISNNLSALLWSLVEASESRFMIWIIAIYALLTNILFFIFWVHAYFDYLKVKMNLIKSFMISLYNRLIKGNNKGKAKEKRKSSSNEKSNDYKDLYLSSLQKINELQIELDNQKKLYESMISQKFQLNENLREMSKEGTLNTIPDLSIAVGSKVHTNKFIVKKPDDVGELLKFSLKSKSIHAGATLSDHFCRFIYIFHNNEGKHAENIRLDNFKSLTEDWGVTPQASRENNMMCFDIFRKKPWSTPSLLEHITVEFDLYESILQDTEVYRTSNLTIAIGLSDFVILKYIHTLDSSYLAKEQRIPLFEFQRTQARNYDDFFGKFGNPETLIVRVGIEILVLAKADYALEVIAYNNGKLEVYGELSLSNSEYLKQYFENSFLY